MQKTLHEIRDPLHVFIKLDNDERRVLDSRPFQRLRDIHQLAMTYLVYPGATHKRFEHSLGVMELAGRIFDVITAPSNVQPEAREILGELQSGKDLGYWRRVLRMAALCHDIGHLPFSHAAEDGLLPQNWDHERITLGLIHTGEMTGIWATMNPPLEPADIAKLAVGPKDAGGTGFTQWETLLSQIITGNAFGADRIDYLLRDSYHTGVAYGKFDHYRLIDTLRILPAPAPMLGVEAGGLQSAEALLLARYFMFSQVYLHPVRRIYDIHLKDFLCSWLGKCRFPVQPGEHLDLSDSDVIAAMRKASKTNSAKGHEHARRIMQREHFKILYRRSAEDVPVKPDAPRAIYKAAVEQFGHENVIMDSYRKEKPVTDFPVLLGDGCVVNSSTLSQTLSHLPAPSVDFIFIEPNLREKGIDWLKKNRDDIINN